MRSEIDSLRQENARLIARITELEGEKMEVKKIIADSSAEIGKLSARIEELENKPDTAKLESETVELRERVTELQQRKLQDDNSSNSSPLSNFNSEESSDLPPAIDIVNEDQFNNANTKSLEEMEMDAFLSEVHKKSISNEIRKRNKEKQLLHESTENQTQVLPPITLEILHDAETIASDHQLTSGESKLSHKRKISIWLNLRKNTRRKFC
ncbi:hypothetical protein C1645_572471 [Glomus cerebriforme]|uniref:Uncharacterized protein n=1 Tax=Glomus cerebriforme TaxID=658196 RepID=A0A397TDF8_9GLOM|nr:hypothetical protein C1645_572471 [Glomus cerebriforme]